MNEARKYSISLGQNLGKAWSIPYLLLSKVKAESSMGTVIVKNPGSEGFEPST